MREAAARGGPAPLARRKTADRGPLREFLAFSLGAGTYAIEIARIGAILKVPPITPVPRAPDEVMGIISVRGKVIAVLDLRRRLKLAESPPARTARILLLPTKDADTVGLFVEQVHQVYRLRPDEIEPAARALGADIGDHVIGIGRKAGAMLVLMDLSPILKTFARSK
jgi:purine-binding chemotaxis protein CheW